MIILNERLWRADNGVCLNLSSSGIVLNNLMILSDETICLATAQRHTNKEEDGDSF